MKYTILYIDDEESNLISFKYQFTEYYNVLTALSASKAFDILVKTDVEVIIADQRMPNMTGTEFFENIQNKYPDPARMILTGYSDIKAVIDGINKGKIYYYLQKPWKEDEIKMVLNNAIDSVLLTRKNAKLIEQLRIVNEELMKHQEHLEELVKERTKDLEKKNDELEQFNKLFIDREFRIKELKDKVKLLEKKIVELEKQIN